MVKFYIIQDDDIALNQCWNQEMFNIQIEHLSIKCSFNHHRSPKSCQAQGANARDIVAMIEWFNYFRPFPLRRTSVRSGHRGIDGEFIKEYEPLGNQSFLTFLEAGPLFRIGFRCKFGLFFRVMSSLFNARRIVQMLTLIPALFSIRSRSSSRIASGNSSTMLWRIGRCSSLSMRTAPPPLGSGSSVPCLR